MPPRFSPCKSHSREMAQTSGFDSMLNIKTCFDCTMFDLFNWLLVSTEKMVQEGLLQMTPFQFHLEHWRYPRPLDSLLPWSETISAHLVWLQHPVNLMKGAYLHPKDHSIQMNINVLELKAVFPEKLQEPVSNPTVLVAMDNSTVVSSIDKQGGTHSAEICALPWKIMNWCHPYQITLRASHTPACLNVADLLSRSKKAQSTERSLHLQVSKQICQKMDHSSCRSICHSFESQSSIVCISSGLTAYAYPPTALLQRVIQKNQEIQLSHH